MGTPLPRGPCCSRLPQAASSQPSSQPLALSSHGRTNTSARRQRRVVISAFLFKAVKRADADKGDNRSRETITNRLSELRTRSEDENRAPQSDRAERLQREHDSSADVASSSEGTCPGPRPRSPMGPWPAEQSDEEEAGGNMGEGNMVASGLSDGPVTPRSLRYMVTDPKPEIKLLHRFKPGHGPHDVDFWRSFMDKCRLAWGVFFPPAHHHQVARSREPTPGGGGAGELAKWAGGIGRLLEPGPATDGGEAAGGGGGGGSGLSAKQVVLSRLQMVLIADRCGVSPEHLLEMKAQTLTALAEYMGKDLEEDVAQLEVQVSALKPNGERITMTIGFADMLADEQLRDPIQYHYEHEDDDDYFMPEEDDGRVADIAEAPAAGFKIARVAAAPVAGRDGYMP